MSVLVWSASHSALLRCPAALCPNLDESAAVNRRTMALKWKNTLAIAVVALMLAGFAAAEVVEFQNCDG